MPVGWERPAWAWVRGGLLCVVGFCFFLAWAHVQTDLSRARDRCTTRLDSTRDEGEKIRVSERHITSQPPSLPPSHARQAPNDRTYVRTCPLSSPGQREDRARKSDINRPLLLRSPHPRRRALPPTSSEPLARSTIASRHRGDPEDLSQGPCAAVPSPSPSRAVSAPLLAPSLSSQHDPKPVVPRQREQNPKQRGHPCKQASKAQPAGRTQRPPSGKVPRALARCQLPAGCAAMPDRSERAGASEGVCRSPGAARISGNREIAIVARSLQRTERKRSLTYSQRSEDIAGARERFAPPPASQASPATPLSDTKRAGRSAEARCASRSGKPSACSCQARAGGTFRRPGRRGVGQGARGLVAYVYGRASASVKEGDGRVLGDVGLVCFGPLALGCFCRRRAEEGLGLFDSFVSSGRQMPWGASLRGWETTPGGAAHSVRALLALALALALASSRLQAGRQAGGQAGLQPGVVMRGGLTTLCCADSWERRPGMCRS